jgi:hydroxymethylpyrimidine/phosphomethylpyrimidine kinase
MKVVMTIAGSDSGGGAGIQADLKTFQELKVFGTSAITSLTAQNTNGVHEIYPVDPLFVRKQIEVLVEDFNIAAIKTGMLYSEDIIEEVYQVLKDLDVPLIIDPVMVAKGGSSLLHEKAVHSLRTKLLSISTMVTPNIPEAEVLSGIAIVTPEDRKMAAKIMMSYGAECVVIKGGHIDNQQVAEDTVYLAGGETFSLQSERVHTKNTHGTGCTFSAAITAFLANGYSTREAILEAKKFIQMGIKYDLHLGHGHGPTNHFAYNQYEKCGVILN